MRFCYCDPPYPGLSRRYYGDHRDFKGEVDHAELVSRLTRGSYDGWAISTSAEALRDVWALCPPETRLCVWVNGPRKTKSYTALHAFEAVLVWGGRPRQVPVVEDLSDVLLWGGRQHSHPGALVGMKPAAFCAWLFELLGACRDDTLDDFFPGSGAVERAWDLFTSSPPGSDDTVAGRFVVADPRDGVGSPPFQQTYSEGESDAQRSRNADLQLRQHPR